MNGGSAIGRLSKIARRPDHVMMDPHIHSNASYDGKSSIEAILKWASEIGLDVIAITDHDEIGESIRAAEMAPEYGLLAVPGAEVSTADGHLLGLGIEELPEKGKPIEETIEEIRGLGGIAIVPHPFQKSRHGAGAIKDCDAFEVYNSRLVTGRSNRKAKKFAQENDLPGVAGSDAHTYKMVGRASTEIKADIDMNDPDIGVETKRKAVLDGIKEGMTRAHGKRTPLYLSFTQVAKGASRKAARNLKSQMTGFL